MASLNFNAYAHDLESAVGTILRGLDAAERALRDDEARVTAEMKQHNRKIEAGEVSGGWVGDDGDDDYDSNEIYAYDFTTIESTQMEVRKSMMVALYRAWERAVRSMARKKGAKDNHADLKATLKDHGISIAPQLDHLRALVNLTKHNSRQKMFQACKVWPDPFYGGFHLENYFPDN